MNQLQLANHKTIIIHFPNAFYYCYLREMLLTLMILLQTVHLSVNMRSPYVVIPEHGTLHV